MSIHEAQAQWHGDLKTGNGRMRMNSGYLDGTFDFHTRFEQDSGTNPEEMIGAALAGCYSMALTKMLEDAGFHPKSITTRSRVHLNKIGANFKLTAIDLETKAHVPDIAPNEFAVQAEAAKEGCPVSQALNGVEINLKADMVNPENGPLEPESY